MISDNISTHCGREHGRISGLIQVPGWLVAPLETKRLLRSAWMLEARGCCQRACVGRRQNRASNPLCVAAYSNRTTAEHRSSSSSITCRSCAILLRSVHSRHSRPQSRGELQCRFEPGQKMVHARSEMVVLYTTHMALMVISSCALGWLLRLSVHGAATRHRP